MSRTSGHRGTTVPRTRPTRSVHWACWHANACMGDISHRRWSRYMSHLFHFGIQGQRIGPLDPEATKQRIEQGEITRLTLAWRDGMTDWLPVSAIAELMEAFGDLLAAHAVPPP